MNQFSFVTGSKYGKTTTSVSWPYISQHLLGRAIGATQLAANATDIGPTQITFNLSDGALLQIELPYQCRGQVLLAVVRSAHRRAFVTI